MLHYTLESPLGRWAEDGSRFIYDAGKVAALTGYKPEEVEALGARHCLNFPRQNASIGTASPQRSHNAER